MHASSSMAAFCFINFRGGRLIARDRIKFRGCIAVIPVVGSWIKMFVYKTIGTAQVRTVRTNWVKVSYWRKKMFVYKTIGTTQVRTIFLGGGGQRCAPKLYAKPPPQVVRWRCVPCTGCGAFRVKEQERQCQTCGLWPTVPVLLL